MGALKKQVYDWLGKALIKDHQVNLVYYKDREDKALSLDTLIYSVVFIQCRQIKKQFSKHERINPVQQMNFWTAQWTKEFSMCRLGRTEST